MCELIDGSPSPRTTRSPSSTPRRIGPRANSEVDQRKSGPSCVSATAPVTIFMFDAGMNSLSALREYSVSPRTGSTTRIPQYPLRKSGAFAIESMNDASASRLSGGAATTAGTGRVGGAGWHGVRAGAAGEEEDDRRSKGAHAGGKREALARGGRARDDERKMAESGRDRNARCQCAPSASSGVLAVGKSSADCREVGQRIDAEQQSRRIAERGELRCAEPADGGERVVERAGAPLTRREQSLADGERVGRVVRAQRLRAGRRARRRE